MHAVHLGFLLDPRGATPREAARRLASLVDIAERCGAWRRTGHRGAGLRHVTHRSSAAASTYHFVPPRSRRTASPRDTRPSETVMARAGSRRRAMCTALAFTREVRGVGATLAPRLPILLQDHADRVPRFWRRPAGAADSPRECGSGVSFCARAQAEPFRRAGLLPAHVRQSSKFPSPPAVSRRAIGPRRAMTAASTGSGRVVGGSSGRQQGSADRARWREHCAPQPSGPEAVVLLRCRHPCFRA